MEEQESMDYKIITANSTEKLQKKVQEYLDEKWTLVGGLHACRIHVQNRFSGTQHMDSLYEYEYSQGICKITKGNNQ